MRQLFLRAALVELGGSRETRLSQLQEAIDAVTAARLAALSKIADEQQAGR